MKYIIDLRVLPLIQLFILSCVMKVEVLVTSFPMKCLILELFVIINCEKTVELDSGTHNVKEYTEHQSRKRKAT